ncbi:MAG: ABC transporter permease, partial [Candidatus Heimdallarchaeota archaeon]|nr:ABC transporter permease [Candidatus Heimdallarchaeota archaeon]
MKTIRITKIAFKSLLKNKFRTLLMMIGVIIGVAALTIIVSAALGSQNRIMRLVEKFGLNNIAVFSGPGREIGYPFAGETTTTLTLEDAEALRNEIKNINCVVSINRKQDVEVKFKERSTTVLLIGATPAFSDIREWYVNEGDFITDENMASLKRVCVIGETVRKELFRNLNPIGERILIGNVQFRIKGIMPLCGVSPAGEDFDNRIYIPLSTFMRRVANIDYIFGIRAMLKDPKDIIETVTNIKSLLRERHKLPNGVPDDFSIRTPKEITEMSERLSGTFNIFLVLVAGISLIAGGVVIANIMLISVNERKKEIGLRKAVGARSKDIKLQFLFESIAVTLTGGVIGIVLGITGAKFFSIIAQ